jgi:hypothetical protein
VVRGFKALWMNSKVFWDMIPCSLVNRYRQFERTFCLLLLCSSRTQSRWTTLTMEIAISSCNTSDWLFDYSLSFAVLIRRNIYNGVGCVGQYVRMNGFLRSKTISKKRIKLSIGTRGSLTETRIVYLTNARYTPYR